MLVRCLGCMEEIEAEQGICPYCGYVIGTEAEELVHMQPGTILSDRYVIGKVLGYGGFGVTYIGWDGKLERKVAIKEYLPGEFSTRMVGQTQVTILGGNKAEQFRDGLKKFVEEARKLAKFQNEEGIVKIYDSFEENDTAYIIMEYLDGITLTEYLNENGVIPEDVAVEMLMPIMESLEVVHSYGILHRDIAPDNIMITKEGKFKLIDFGASRYATTSHSRSLTVIVKPGYSPEEQYRSRGDQGPYTDVYALSATMYKMITGKRPPDAMERHAIYENKGRDILKEPHTINKDISRNRENAILNALNVRIEDRTQDVQSFIEELEADPPVKRRYGTIKKLDFYSWPLWVKLVASISTVAVVVFGVLLATNVIKFSSTMSGLEYIDTPDLIGKTAEEAGNLKEFTKEEKSLKLEEGYKKFSENEEKDIIVDQSPSAGEPILYGDIVYYNLSNGSAEDYKIKFEDGETEIIPNYVDMYIEDFYQLQSELEANGLTVKVVGKYSDEQEGTIISQNPPAGEEIKKGDIITIEYSIGHEPVDMPNLLAEGEITLEEAVWALKSQYNISNEVDTEAKYDDDHKEGILLGQYPAAGTEIDSTTTIVLTYSTPNPTAKIPAVTGKTKNDAEDILKSNGFKNILVEELWDSKVEKGNVIKSIPSSGQESSKKDNVCIYISKGPQPIKIHFDSGSSSMTKYVGKTYGELPTPTRDYYTFDGWYRSSNYTGEEVTSNSTVLETDDEITLYAHWTANKYTITFNGGTGASGSTSSMTMSYNETKNLNSNGFSRSGYSFDGWKDTKGNHYSNNQSVKNLCTESNGTVTMTAQWKASTYTVYFDSNGGSCSQNSKSVTYNATYGTLPTPTRDYYTFDGWYTASSGGSEIKSSSVMRNTSNQTLYAQWTENGLSDWVSYDSVKNRSDIKIEEYKWSENKMSSNSSISGWTCVGESYTLNAKGSPTAPSTTQRQESELLKLYNSYSEQKTTGYYIDYYTNTSGANRYYYDYKPSNCNFECHGTATIEMINSAPTVAPGKYCSSAYWKGTNKTSKTAYVLTRPDDGHTALFFLGSPITKTVTYYQYQEYEKKYTYKFSRECTGYSYPNSSSDVTVGNIRVKYRSK